METEPTHRVSSGKPLPEDSLSVADSVPGHVPDLTSSPLHVGNDLLLSPILLLLHLP